MNVKYETQPRAQNMTMLWEKFRKETSICKGIFYRSKISIELVLKISHFWLEEANWTRIQTCIPVSGAGATNYFGYFRQLVVDEMITAEEIIGSQGIVVEIDESKFSKRKCDRGKWCGDGSWIFGGIEKIDEKICFAMSAMKCDAETFIPIVQALNLPE